MWVLLVAATVSWRKGVYYEGGADPVVLAKAALSLMALGLAIHLVNGTRQLLPLAITPVAMLVSYLVVTVVGAYAQHELGASLVVAIRLAILILAVTLILTREPAYEAMRKLVHVLGALTLLAVLTGLGGLTSGRLRGGIPPIDPNELALTSGVCFLWLFAKILRAAETRTELVLALGCGGIMLLTGSRTGLAALAIAIMIMILRATSLTEQGFAVFALMFPVLAYVALGTDVLTGVLFRGGARSVTTLSNRTIAWDAALAGGRDYWDTWLGAGLARKKVEVPGQWWNTQLLDSSWISALVQGGLVGLALVVLLSVATIVRAARPGGKAGALWLGLVLFLCTRAFLESGLFDSSLSFMVFLVTAYGCRGITSTAPAFPTVRSGTDVMNRRWSALWRIEGRWRREHSR